MPPRAHAPADGFLVLDFAGRCLEYLDSPDCDLPSTPYHQALLWDTARQVPASALRSRPSAADVRAFSDDAVNCFLHDLRPGPLRSALKSIRARDVVPFTPPAKPRPRLSAPRGYVARRRWFLKEARDILTADWGTYNDISPELAELVVAHLALVLPAVLFRLDPQPLKDEEVWLVAYCLANGASVAESGALTDGPLLRALLARPFPCQATR